MSHAISGWSVVPLGQVVDIFDNLRRPVNKKERATRPGKIPYYGSTGQTGTIDGFLFDEELVLLGEDAAPFLDPAAPKAYIIRGKSWVNNHAHVLRARNSIEAKFLKYQLDCANYRPFVSGTTRLKLSQGPMRNIPVMVPPITEQRRIVEAIESHFTRLDAAVTALERVRAQLKRYRTSVISAAITGELVGVDDSDWRDTTVGAHADLVQYGTSAKTSSDDSGVPVLRMGNLKDGSIVLDDLKFLPHEHKEFPQLFLKAGDLLFNRTNSPELVGKTAVFRGSPSPCSFASYLVRVRFRPTLLPDFVTYFTNGPKGREWVKEVVSQQVGQANVNSTKLRAMKIRIPEVTVQAEIIAEVERRLSLSNVLVSEVDRALAKCGRMRQAILKRAFEGRLVPQDPADEPASVMLERLKLQPPPARARARKQRK